MVDDYLPFWIASNPDQKSSREVTSLIGCGHVWDILTPVFNKTPILGLKDKNQTVAIWPVILEKALVKSLGGYHKLLNSDTSTLEYLKDFTSSPGLSIDITHPKFQQMITQCLIDKQIVYFEIKNVPFMVESLEGSKISFKSHKTSFKNIFGDAVITNRQENVYIIDLQDLLQMNESWTTPAKFNILKINNTYEYNSVHIPLSAQHYVHSIIKIGVQEEGTYHFSVVQKSKSLYPKNKYFYNKCTLTLGKLNEGGVEYIDSTTTSDVRDTTLSVSRVDTECSFILLVDIESNYKNYEFEE